MDEEILLFFFSNKNKNSICALLASLEVYGFVPNFYLIEKKEEIEHFCKRYKKVILVLSYCTTEALEFYKLSLELKRKLNNLIIISGGPHPSGCPYETMLLGSDYICYGEGEESFPKLIESIFLDLSRIPKNVFYWDGDKIEFKSGNKIIDLDKYRSFPFKIKNLTSYIEITRGCPFGCKYCQTSFLFGRKIRHRSVEKILEHVEVMLKRNKKDIRFISPNSFSYGSKDGRSINLGEIEELLSSIYERVKSKGRIFFGTFPSEVRPEFVEEDVLEIVKKYCFNRKIIIGAQSGSERILELINRQHSTEDVIRAVKLCVKYGFEPNIDIIFGLPGETKEDQIKTIEFCKELIRLGAKIHFHYFMPLPQTPFWLKNPSDLSKEVFKFVGAVTREGKGYGEFISQIERSRKILKLREFLLNLRRKYFEGKYISGEELIKELKRLNND